MKRIIISIGLVLLMVIPYKISLAESNLAGKYSVSGYIKDASNGEELIGATVVIKDLNIGTSTNVYGYYSIALNPGSYTILYSFIGYKPIEKRVELKQNTTISIELKEETLMLQEVVVSSERPNANVTRTEMSVARLDIKTIRRMPALMAPIHQ